MLFTEFRFFFFFLLVFLVYWKMTSNSWRKSWLLLCSYVFYAAWDWRFLSLILISTLIDFLAGLKLTELSPSKRKGFWLLISLCANLGFLGFFKYYNFFIESIAESFHFFGIPFTISTLNIILPVGISFYTFQSMSYSIDVYRGKIKAISNFRDFALYISFFPQLVAGPIVRALDFLPQLRETKMFSAVDVKSCLVLFLVGFIKKACISDNLAPIVDIYFATPEAFTATSAWLGVLAYTVQIYCDFSGYSDMAIACASLLGYQLPINFNYPYFASDIRDFWRRWHISLSTWLREYLYIPLGGNRVSQLMTYRNLMITMLLGGLWHGANWTFVIWGGLHGIALIVNREWSFSVNQFKTIKSILATVSPLLTFYFVCITWIFFRSPDLPTALIILKSCLLFSSLGVQQLRLTTLPILLIFAVFHWLRCKKVDRLWWDSLSATSFAAFYGFALATALLFVPTNYTPFIYFQF